MRTAPAARPAVRSSIAWRRRSERRVFVFFPKEIADLSSASRRTARTSSPPPRNAGTSLRRRRLRLLAAGGLRCAARRQARPFLEDRIHGRSPDWRGWKSSTRRLPHESAADLFPTPSLRDNSPQRVREHLFGHILPFWCGPAVDHEQGGWMAWLANDLTARPHAAQGTDRSQPHSLGVLRRASGAARAALSPDGRARV